MEDLVTEASPGKAATPPPPRRSVRRRLVQSTLFPHKPPEHNAKDNDDKGNENDDEYCPSSKKKKRKPNPKPKPKLTPPEKPSKNSTPKKNASANGNKRSTSKQVLTDSDEVATHVPDLRLEAKISAEENARLSAGRQIHPFFSSWKALKKSQEQAEIGNKFCAHKKNSEAITCGPIHVFENVQEDTLCLDWRNWTFLGKDNYVNYAPESYDDKTLSALDTSGVSISHNALTSSDRLSIQPENVQATSLSENLAMPANEQTIFPQMLKDAEVDLKVDESVTFSGQARIFRKSYADPLSRFLQESMKSYYHNCKDKAESSLWTYKYKPTKATEVCGNDESVNFLRDWLQQWHERRYQGRKNSSNRDKWDMQDGDDDDDDGDYNCSLSDYDSEDLTEKDALHNVLLITGPIGSGKSAAVYACAQEQGFEIFELNASDCRNGPAVKQYFGDTLGSLGFKRLPEDIESSQKKTMKLSPAMALPKDKTADEMDDGMVEPITISDDEACGPAGTSQKLPCKNSVLTCHKVQTLILVEEVDILFPEDRGCIAAIQQIAETARGPIILISNSDDPRLPDNFDRLNLSFSLPSPKELLCHLYKVCVSEGVNIHPLLLEKFIQSCNGDIRKTIMNLQFWFQSMQFRKDGKAQTGYGSLPFDLGLGHQILPKLIPWDFPSELSELVEKELANSISITEENSRLQGMQNDLDAHDMETDYREAKKLEMIKRNETTADYTELEIQYNISEFSDSFGSPQALPTQNDGRRKLIVMSSDSEDEDPNNVHLQCTHDEADKSQSLNDNNESPSKFQLNEHHSGTSFRKLVCSELEDQEEEFFRFSETANTCESLDISCVPESTYVPETAIENEIETMSGAVSSGLPAVPPEISVNNELKPLGVRRRLVKFPENPCLLVNNGFPESPSKEAVQDFYNENPETAIVHVMDECSRVDFQLKSKFVESTPMIETDTVQKLWRNLRECQTDLGRHAMSEQLGAFEVVKLVSELSNLISEADLFFDHRGQCDVMEPAMSLSGEATASWYDEEIMMSTVAVSGFCFYVNRIADEGSKLGFENKVDLTSEMLASTTNIMTLGKLSRADLTKSTDIYTGKESELDNPVYDVHKSENNTSLFNIIQSIVPARISLVLKGVAFNEYLSSMRQISRSEDFRVSQGVRRRGRVRGSQHYLSKCTMLSPEDISLVSERDFCKKISSQCTANEENKHT